MNVHCLEEMTWMEMDDLDRYPDLFKSQSAPLPPVLIDVAAEIRKGMKTFKQMGQTWAISALLKPRQRPSAGFIWKKMPGWRLIWP